MGTKTASAAMGRPRAFDPDKALEAAMQVFWRKGYEGASLTDLTRAMGINRPSMYAAFGDKRALFRKALERYNAGPANFVEQALAEKAARAMAEKLLRGTVELVTCPKNPHGCLMVQGALPANGEPACGDLASIREAGVAKIRKRLKRAQAEGDLPRESNPASLARYLATVVHGIAVQASSGAGKKELERVVDVAMSAWPK